MASEPNFSQFLKDRDLTLNPVTLETLQVNITKLCNQACVHCHVNASPKRTEQMDRKTIDRCLDVLAAHASIKNLDITGGAPELNPNFEYLVKTGRSLGKHIMVRHNLTVTFDGNPQTGESKMHLPKFFAEQKVEVISSLPFHQEFFTDKQRGKGVFEKSIESLKLLNREGYGQEDSGLILNLVYNPVGSYLPPAQQQLEKDYKKSLREKHGITFNRLFTLTNMPIERFKMQLEKTGAYGDYMERLMGSFNPGTVAGVMCRNMLSVGYDGSLYDCDFNQMCNMKLMAPAPQTIFTFDYEKILHRNVVIAPHCFGCTAGAGSSCGGATV